MTEQQFDARLKEIEVRHGQRQEAASAALDQELSRLFEESGWTQEKIAERMGKNQGWVSRRLCFGRFLNFMPTRHNPPDLARLTECAFRRCWAKTQKNDKEEDRFRQVSDLLAGCPLPGRYRNMLTKPGYASALRDLLAGGKWHKSEALLADLEGRFHDFTSEQLHGTLSGLKRAQGGKVVESKKRGATWLYRLVDAPAVEDAGKAASVALYEEVKPFIEQLLSMSKRHRAELAPGELAKMAVRMQRLFEAACGEDTVNG